MPVEALSTPGQETTLSALTMTSVQTNTMSRNIWITFEDWTQLRKELEIKRQTDKWGTSDEYWNFFLHDNQIKEWKKDVKKYPRYSEKCFQRVGLDREMLKKVKTPGIYNRLLKSNWRGQDIMNDMFPNSYHREKDMNWIINNFIAWAMNNVHGIDEDLTVEEWKQINSIMSKKMKLTNRETFMFYELEKLFNEVCAHMPVRKLANSV